MKTLVDQTLYQCEYCQKRFITKQGAKRHEETHCYLSPIPKAKKLEKIKACKHDFHMQYTPMLGESHLLEPDGEECIKCGVTEMEWKKIKEEIV